MERSRARRSRSALRQVSTLPHRQSQRNLVPPLFFRRGPKSGVAAAGWNRIRLFYHPLPPFGNRLWSKFSAFRCLYWKTLQKTPSSPVLFSVIRKNYCVFSFFYCKSLETMLNYCVPVGAHIMDKVFFVQGQVNCFLRSGITCTKRSKPAPLFCWPWL